MTSYRHITSTATIPWWDKNILRGRGKRTFGEKYSKHNKINYNSEELITIIAFSIHTS